MRRHRRLVVLARLALTGNPLSYTTTFQSRGLDEASSSSTSSETGSKRSLSCLWL